MAVLQLRALNRRMRLSPAARFPCSYQTVDGDFQLRFRHKFDSAEETFFAYTYPNSYEEVQVGAPQHAAAAVQPSPPSRGVARSF